MTKLQTRALGTVTLLAVSLLTHAHAQTTPVQYVFAHGLSNNCDTFFNTGTGSATCTTPAGSSLAGKIKTGGNASASVYGQTIETKSMGIAAQGQTFLNGMNSTGSSLPKVIVAHSQGTLRSRYALQRLPNGANNVKGFIGISGPHAGAPITVNTPPFLRAAIADFNTAGLAILVPNILPSLVAVGLVNRNVLEIPREVFTDKDTTYRYLENLAGATPTDPGFTDLYPGSSFLNNINNLTNCYWVWNGGFSVVCSSNGGTLPSTVSVASIVGKNNKFWDGLIDPNGAAPLNRSTVSTALGFVRTYAYSQQAGCNGSLRLWQAACNSWNATLRFLDKTEDQDRTLRTVVGSDEGDGTVALSSQSVYGASPSLGGTNLGVFDVVDGSHGGFNPIVNKLGTIRAIRRIQELMSIPQSNSF
jgi:pimeloyl-ACP methyl ester carboxylesterase